MVSDTLSVRGVLSVKWAAKCDGTPKIRFQCGSFFLSVFMCYRSNDVCGVGYRNNGNRIGSGDK